MVFVCFSDMPSPRGLSSCLGASAMPVGRAAVPPAFRPLLPVKHLTILEQTVVSWGALSEVPAMGLCDGGFSHRPAPRVLLWGGQRRPGPPLVPLGRLTWHREAGTPEGARLISGRLVRLPRAPRRPCLAAAQASLSESGPFEKPLGNTFDKWPHAGAWRAAGPARAPAWLPAWVPGPYGRSRQPAGPRIPVRWPRSPSPRGPLLGSASGSPPGLSEYLEEEKGPRAPTPPTWGRVSGANPHGAPPKLHPPPRRCGQRCPSEPLARALGSGKWASLRLSVSCPAGRTVFYEASVAVAV